MSTQNVKVDIRPERRQIVAQRSGTKQGFNGEGRIRLADYTDGREPRKQHNATFEGYDFLDLRTVNLNDEEYFNMAIRDEADDERIKDLVNEFNLNGWNTAPFPPIYGMDGKCRDGRGRIIAAIENGERWIPVAVYTYDDDTSRSMVTNGLKANRHLPANPSKMKNFINGGVSLIIKEELECDKESIKKWLYEEVEITDFFTHLGGAITKIINQIYDLGSRDEIRLIHRADPKMWKSWVAEHYGPDVHLMSVDNNQYLFRTWGDHIREAVMKGTQPVKVVLYTNDTRPDSARDKMAIRIKEFESMYKMCFDVVNASVEGIELKPKSDAERPWKILGAIPQVIGDHDIGSTRLVPVDQY